MKLSTDILYEELSNVYALTRYGVDIEDLALCPPTFYAPGQAPQEGALYICEAGTLAAADVLRRATRCLFIVSGTLDVSARGTRASILLLEDVPELLEVFNAVQSIYLKYESWVSKLQEILNTTSDIRQMTQITSELLDECIGLCNKDLKLVLFHNPRPKEFVPVTHLTADGIQSFAPTHKSNVMQRGPFIDRGEKNTYCLNIYKNEEYLGVLVLAEIYHPLSKGRMSLFDLFFTYMYKAIDKLNLDTPNGLINLKMVLKSLLRGDAVDEDLLASLNTGPGGVQKKWLVLSANLANPMKAIPADFICQKIEATNPLVVSVEHEGYIVVLVPVEDEASCWDFSPRFLTAIETLLGSAGASIVFNHIENVRTYRLQAAIAQRTANISNDGHVIARFSDHAFAYLMNASSTELTPKYLLPKELVALRKPNKAAGEVDNWDILKCYLDSHMKLSQTARALYLHRTTLQYRVDQILKAVDLSTPERCLYIHYCMHLYDYYEKTLAHVS